MKIICVVKIYVSVSAADSCEGKLYDCNYELLNNDAETLKLNGLEIVWRKSLV